MNNNSIDIERIRKNKENKEKSTITPRMILLIILCTIIAGGIGFIVWKLVKKHILEEGKGTGITDAVAETAAAVAAAAAKKEAAKVEAKLAAAKLAAANKSIGIGSIDSNTFIRHILPIII